MMLLNTQYVPNLSKEEAKSHQIFEEKFDELCNVELAAMFGGHSDWENEYALKNFAAAFWSAAFKRAAELREMGEI